MMTGDTERVAIGAGSTAMSSIMHGGSELSAEKSDMDCVERNVEKMHLNLEDKDFGQVSERNDGNISDEITLQMDRSVVSSDPTKSEIELCSKNDGVGKDCLLQTDSKPVSWMHASGCDLDLGLDPFYGLLEGETSSSKNRAINSKVNFRDHTPSSQETGPGSMQNFQLSKLNLASGSEFKMAVTSVSCCDADLVKGRNVAVAISTSR
jgi:hypothetical protein